MLWKEQKTDGYQWALAWWIHKQEFVVKNLNGNWRSIKSCFRAGNDLFLIKKTSQHTK